MIELKVSYASDSVDLTVKDGQYNLTDKYDRQRYCKDESRTESFNILTEKLDQISRNIDFCEEVNLKSINSKYEISRSYSFIVKQGQEKSLTREISVAINQAFPKYFAYKLRQACSKSINNVYDWANKRYQ